MFLPKDFDKKRQLNTLVENQTSYALSSAELHIFETHKEAEQVLLKFHQPVLASMIEGKKVMHLNNSASFNFLPGESLMLPSNELMCIDFPEAKLNTPTRCFAMAIDEDKIARTVQFLNEQQRKPDGEWSFVNTNFHFAHDEAVQQIIQRLICLFSENHPSKDIFADMMLRELVIRIMQTENRHSLTQRTTEMSGSHRLAHVIEFIRKNLHLNLTVELLSNRVHMSPSNFQRVFKQELGKTPVNFINHERMKLAKSLLRQRDIKIKEVGYLCGFNNISYFNRYFKRATGLTPKAFQVQHRTMVN